MSVISPSQQFVADSELYLLDVSIVMPCLNEIISLRHCIANAQDALDQIFDRYGLTGEIVIADNGSTDGSQALASSLGARVVPVAERGYGAALIGGCRAAAGRYILMGDCDGSYNFVDGVAMIGRLDDGADICMGSRFKGGIEPGAMPWKNRYIGNPVLTGILNLFFRSGVSDAHCGLRAITKDAFHALGLTGSGMEFASEMVIKGALKRLRMDEVPASLSRDLRDRAPHLRPWRDGWRHLRYLLMLSPRWIFGIPAAFAMGLGAMILVIATLFELKMIDGHSPFGTGWTIMAGFLLTTGHFAFLMGLAMDFHGVRAGYRLPKPQLKRWRGLLTLEASLMAGLTMLLLSIAVFTSISIRWSAGEFASPPSVLMLTFATLLSALGLQSIFGGFVLSIVAGHEARFVDSANK